MRMKFIVEVDVEPKSDLETPYIRAVVREEIRNAICYAAEDEDDWFGCNVCSIEFASITPVEEK